MRLPFFLSFCFGSFLYFFDFFGRSTCCLITLTGAGGVGRVRLVVVARVVGTFVGVAETSLPPCDGDQTADDDDELKLLL